MRRSPGAHTPAPDATQKKTPEWLTLDRPKARRKSRRKPKKHLDNDELLRRIDAVTSRRPYSPPSPDDSHGLDHLDDMVKSATSLGLMDSQWLKLDEAQQHDVVAGVSVQQTSLDATMAAIKTKLAGITMSSPHTVRVRPTGPRDETPFKSSLGNIGLTASLAATLAQDGWSRDGPVAIKIPRRRVRKQSTTPPLQWPKWAQLPGRLTSPSSPPIRVSSTLENVELVGVEAVKKPTRTFGSRTSARAAVRRAKAADASVDGVSERQVGSGRVRVQKAATPVTSSSRQAGTLKPPRQRPATSKPSRGVHDTVRPTETAAKQAVTHAPAQAPTHIATHAPTHTSTHVPTHTPADTATDAPTPTLTPTPTPTLNTPTPTPTLNTPTHTPTHTPTLNTPTHTPTHTPTLARTDKGKQPVAWEIDTGKKGKRGGDVRSTGAHTRLQTGQAKSSADTKSGVGQAKSGTGTGQAKSGTGQGKSGTGQGKGGTKGGAAGRSAGHAKSSNGRSAGTGDVSSRKRITRNPRTHRQAQAGVLADWLEGEMARDDAESGVKPQPAVPSHTPIHTHHTPTTSSNYLAPIQRPTTALPQHDSDMTRALNEERARLLKARREIARLQDVLASQEGSDMGHIAALKKRIG